MMASVVVVTQNPHIYIYIRSSKKKSETMIRVCRSKTTMIRMASVVIRSPLFISSQNKSENMKGITRLLLTTTSSVVPSYSNSHIPFTVVKTRLMSTLTTDGYHTGKLPILSVFPSLSYNLIFDMNTRAGLGSTTPRSPVFGPKIGAPPEVIEQLQTFHIHVYRIQISGHDMATWFCGKYAQLLSKFLSSTHATIQHCRHLKLG